MSRKKLLKFEELTVEQKLGMVLCARKFSGADEDNVGFIVELIKNHALGCVQLNANLHEVNQRILEAADYPLLVFNDTERGFPTSTLPKVPLVSLAACDNPAYYRSFARCIARDAKAAGFNGTWGPVIDTTHGDGPCKVHRTFSDDPEKVGETAEIIAEVFREYGYLSTGKHYPSPDHGPVDTHMAGAYSNDTPEDLFAGSLKPYLYLMDRGLLPCIMTGHTTLTKIDPDYPASLSKKVIDLIRERGFDGLCFTDSFAMMGILQKYGEENVYGLAIAAGNDIVLPNYRTDTRRCYEMLKKNFEDGMLPMERLDEAVRRVLKAQEFVAAGEDFVVPASKADEDALYAVARDCITAVTDEGVSAKLPDSGKKRLFIIVTQNDFKPNPDDQEITDGKWYYPDRIAKKIHEEFPDARIEYLPEFPQASHNERVLVAATGCDEVVFVTFCTTSAYLGTDCLTRRVESVINSLLLSGKVEAVVHFGNPYALCPIHHVKRRIFGYLIPESQLHAIEVLSGRLEAKGKLPYRVELP